MKIINVLYLAGLIIAGAKSSIILDIPDELCWAKKLGYECCKKAGKPAYYTDEDGKWSVENKEWCGIVEELQPQADPNCWAKVLGYECCKKSPKTVYYTDDDGEWGVENNDWCGIIKPVEVTEPVAITEPVETTYETYEITTETTYEVTTETTIEEEPTEPVVQTTNVIKPTESTIEEKPTETSLEEPTEEPEGPLTIRDISSKELIKEMIMGWNLGNTLDADCSSWMNYEKDPIGSETCWGNVKTTEGIYKALMDNQFNVFRIPTTWTGHIGEAPDYKINEEWLKRVHEIVDYPYKNGAFVILNTHHESWNHAFSETLDVAKDMLAKIWAQIAEEFKDYDEHLIFEGLNEPRKNGTPVEWNGGDQEGWDAVNEMNAVFMKTIRSAKGNNVMRHLMIPPYAAACNANSFANFIYPENDDKVIASVHAYSPYNFALNTGEGAVDKFDDVGKKDLDYNLGLMKSRFVDQGIPMILGEYGSVNRDNTEERAAWAEYYMEKVTEMGVPQVWWDNGIFEGEGERFGIFDRKNLQVVYPSIVAALQKGRGLEVNVVHAVEQEPGEEPTDEPIEEPTDEPIEEPTEEPIVEPVTVPCWSLELGYECCSPDNTRVLDVDEDGKWGSENGEWCGIVDSDSECWSIPLGYKCCSHCNVVLTDEDGKWGEENEWWCGIDSNKCQ